MGSSHIGIIIWKVNQQELTSPAKGVDVKSIGDQGFSFPQYNGRSLAWTKTQSWKLSGVKASRVRFSFLPQFDVVDKLEKSAVCKTAVVDYEGSSPSCITNVKELLKPLTFFGYYKKRYYLCIYESIKFTSTPVLVSAVYTNSRAILCWYRFSIRVL